jgi:hypothetical protein
MIPMETLVSQPRVSAAFAGFGPTTSFPQPLRAIGLKSMIF